jgi:hypothetical protein
MADAPVAHMFTQSAQGWVLPAAGAECHDTMPADYKVLGARWRAMRSDFFPTG